MAPRMGGGLGLRLGVDCGTVIVTISMRTQTTLGSRLIEARRSLPSSRALSKRSNDMFCTTGESHPTRMTKWSTCQIAGPICIRLATTLASAPTGSKLSTRSTSTARRPPINQAAMRHLKPLEPHQTRSARRSPDQLPLSPSSKTNRLLHMSKRSKARMSWWI